MALRDGDVHLFVCSFVRMSVVRNVCCCCWRAWCWPQHCRAIHITAVPKVSYSVNIIITRDGEICACGGGLLAEPHLLPAICPVKFGLKKIEWLDKLTVKPHGPTFIFLDSMPHCDRQTVMPTAIVRATPRVKLCLDPDRLMLLRPVSNVIRN